jgi:excisionase family DNA binding protein
MKKPVEKLEGYLSIKEAAALLHISPRSVYGYVQSGKLEGKEVGKRSLIVRAESLTQLQAPSAGRPRDRLPIWRAPLRNTLILLAICVPLRANQSQNLERKLAEIRLQKHHLFPGTVERCIGRDENDPNLIHILLFWRKATLPPEAERQAAIAALSEDFAALLDWEHALSHNIHMLLNT